MCRLAIFGGIQKVGPLTTSLEQLEKSMGGDGNGVWNSLEGEILKGVNITPAEIAEEVAGKPGFNLFHTRMSTAGGVRSEINHPFAAGEWVLAHNGHWSSWFSYAEGTISDTQTAASIVEKHGPGVLLNPEFDHSGVWVVANEDGAYVLHRGWTNFYLQPLKGGGFFHASEGIKNFGRKGMYMVPKNSIHFITEDDVYETELSIAPMPEAVWQYEGLGYGYNGSRSYTNYGTSYTQKAGWSSVYDDSFDFDEGEWDRFERELVDGNVTSWREYVEMRKWEDETVDSLAKNDDTFLSGTPTTDFNAGVNEDFTTSEQLALPSGDDS